ncbi:MAG: hypothetical protein OXB88_05655 [Bacteriovoracales bacterium]|nr:hypothetical protein [Bacteriovoracales bacterium]
MSTKKNIVLTERDFKILHFLFENRSVERVDIENQFFGDRQKRNVTRRLKKLRDAKLIEMDKGIDFKSGYYYFLSLKGLKKIYPHGKALRGLKLKSADPGHDLTLLKIRNALEGLGIIHEYYSENMLMLDIIRDQVRHIFRYDDGFIPDALFLTQTKDREIYNAVELELNRKSISRYRDKIQRYYFNDKISYVLFISPSKSIKKIVMEEEKRLYSDKNSKFYYGNLKAFIQEKGPIVLESYDGVKFELR